MLASQEGVLHGVS